ncbi:MAG: hypothetical protein NC102_08975 [Clostridium sp.]|nr:hypothetical protein [Clostridium sp.]
MAFEDQDIFARIIAKANLLAQRYEALQKLKEEADEKIASLQTELSRRETELRRLRQEAEYLRTAAVISPDRDQIEETRAIISGIVREIDRCITDLSD